MASTHTEKPNFAEGALRHQRPLVSIASVKLVSTCTEPLSQVADARSEAASRPKICGVRSLRFNFLTLDIAFQDTLAELGYCVPLTSSSETSASESRFAAGNVGTSLGLWHDRYRSLDARYASSGLGFAQCPPRRSSCACECSLRGPRPGHALGSGRHGRVLRCRLWAGKAPCRVEGGSVACGAPFGNSAGRTETLPPRSPSNTVRRCWFASVLTRETPPLEWDPSDLLWCV